LIEKLFASALKVVLEYKASLIAAKAVKREKLVLCFYGFIKNIQPISVGI
jgi:hypothetical protein